MQTEGALSEVILRRIGANLSRSLQWQEAEAGRARIGRREVPEKRLRVLDGRRRFRGLLGLRFRILRDGRLLMVGFATGVSDEERMESLFDTVARSLEVPGEDVGAPAEESPPAR